jgi:hypothetical protein
MRREHVRAFAADVLEHEGLATACNLGRACQACSRGALGPAKGERPEARP